MAEFHETRMGHRFFEKDVPEIADALKKIADAMTKPPIPHMDAPVRPKMDEGARVSMRIVQKNRALAIVDRLRGLADDLYYTGLVNNLSEIIKDLGKE